MKRILKLALKEFSTYMYSPVGYIFAGLLVTVTAWLYFQDFFVNGQAEMTTYWGTVVFLMTIFVPAISMNLMAEEKKSSTWEVVLSWPISEAEYILGKFLGAMVFVLLALMLSSVTILTLVLVGKPDIGVLLGGLLGVELLGLAYLATGLMVSSFTNQPIVAFLVSVVVLLLNNLMGQDNVLSRIPLLIKDIVANLSLSWHANNFAKGVINLNDLIFYLSWIGVCLVVTHIGLKNRGK